nr:collagen alpha-1(I) chain-like [Aegilops tauschii subsp. strangulata]
MTFVFPAGLTLLFLSIFSFSPAGQGNSRYTTGVGAARGGAVGAWRHPGGRSWRVAGAEAGKGRSSGRELALRREVEEEAWRGRPAGNRRNRPMGQRGRPAARRPRGKRGRPARGREAEPATGAEHPAGAARHGKPATGREEPGAQARPSGAEAGRRGGRWPGTGEGGDAGARGREAEPARGSRRAGEAEPATGAEHPAGAARHGKPATGREEPGAQARPSGAEAGRRGGRRPGTGECGDAGAQGREAEPARGSRRAGEAEPATGAEHPAGAARHGKPARSEPEPARAGGDRSEPAAGPGGEPATSMVRVVDARGAAGRRRGAAPEKRGGAKGRAGRELGQAGQLVGAVEERGGGMRGRGTEQAEGDGASAVVPLEERWPERCRAGALGRSGAERGVRNGSQPRAVPGRRRRREARGRSVRACRRPEPASRPAGVGAAGADPAVAESRTSGMRPRRERKPATAAAADAGGEAREGSKGTARCGAREGELARRGG